MNTILLLGYSSIAQKAIIPALKHHPHVALRAIASRSQFDDIPPEFEAFDDYKDAIDTVRCDTVYVSLHNSAHFEWIMYALEKGKNVICDKPVVLNKKEALEIVKKAAGKRVIFEATPYLYHPTHRRLAQLVHAQDTPLQHISLQFGFPKLPKDNFRNDRTLGGGCILDIGPYVVSVGEYYFRKRATHVASFVHNVHDVPVTASITFQFGKAETLQASIGFNLEYRNHLELWGGEYHFSLDRAFTMPPDLRNTISIKHKDRTRTIIVEATDPFYEMFTFFSTLKESGYGAYNQRLLHRLIMLDAIQKSGKSGRVHHMTYR